MWSKTPGHMPDCRLPSRCARYLTTLVVVAVFGFVIAASADLKEGLVSYWPFETATTEYTPDIISRNDLYFYDMGRSNQVPGRFGQAFSFDGKSQFLALNYSTNETLPIHKYPAYTVAMWVKGPPRQANKILFAEGSTVDRLPLFILGTERNGETAFANVMIRRSQTALIDNIPSGTVVFDNTWQHIAWVDDDGSARLYINGVADSATYNYQRSAPRLNNLSIGALLRNPPVYFFKGEIDEVAVWNRVLGHSEILQLQEISLNSKGK